jgi:hypothetical protein
VHFFEQRHELSSSAAFAASPSVWCAPQTPSRQADACLASNWEGVAVGAALPSWTANINAQHKTSITMARHPFQRRRGVGANFGQIRQSKK